VTNVLCLRTELTSDEWPIIHNSDNALPTCLSSEKPLSHSASSTPTIRTTEKTGVLQPRNYFVIINGSTDLSLLGTGLFLVSFVIFFSQTEGLLGRVISPSQGRYLHTGQHKHRINAHTDIHALSGIRTHDPSFRTSEDSSCLRTRGHRDRQGTI
jgi:hypothetical protein